MKILRLFVSFAALILLIRSFVMADERAEAELQLKDKPLQYLKDGQLFLSSYYEYSWIKQGARKGQWRLFTNTVGYSFDNGITPYLEVNSWDRFHDKDQLINFGGYFKFPDSSYIHSEFGFGNDISYLPVFRALQEYERRLVKNISWQAGHIYLNYPVNDVNIVYPGLVYYFGNNYVSAFYNASFIQTRGTAHWASFKGNFSLSERLNLWLGTAVGERLYDIDLLKASEQYGYIFFSGVDLKVCHDLRLRLGFSYSKERPDFIKRSIDYGFSVKF
jgi:YaiO family outer membrane protein